MAPALSVCGLSVSLGGRGIVSDVDFAIMPGQVLALLGESGCGKSLTAQAIARLLPPSARCGGQVMAGGDELLALSEQALATIRGRRIGMIFQDPRASLDPLMTIGAQLDEVLARHTGLDRRERRIRAIEALQEVGIRDAEARLPAYPHELSGGMCQRIAMALAIAPQPEILIADEPTTALDVTVQRQILDLLRDLQSKNGMAVLLITHDMGVVAAAADHVAVMYAGQIVERACAADLFDNPRHPYTVALMAATPPLASRIDRFSSIPGQVPALDAMPEGCRFAGRCDHVHDRCVQPPPMRGQDHAWRCWLEQAT